MKNLCKIIFLCLVYFINAEAQPVTWQRFYGDSQSFEVGYSIVQLPDDGFIAVGKGPSMRLDKYGNIIWMKNYPINGTGIEKTKDGNFLIGVSKLIKININGDTLWTRPGVIGSKIIISNDGGFYLCGAKFIDPFLTHPYLGKYDSLGFPEWEIIYNNNIIDWAFNDGIFEGGSNLVLIGNYSDSTYITSNPFIMKTDSMGNLIWFKGYNSDSLDYYYLDQIQKNVKGEFIVGGSNNLNCYFMHFSSGGLLKRISYIDSNTQSVQLHSLINTIDNGFAFTGYYYHAPNYYVRLVKTDLEGNELWRILYGNGFSNIGYCVRQTTDSGFIIIGNREINIQSDIYIIKTDKTGFANPPVYINSNSTLIVTDFILYQNYPNPFNPLTNINFDIPKAVHVQIKVYDIKGREIQTLVNDFRKAGHYEVQFDGTDLSSGVYIYRIDAGDFVSSKRFVLLK